MENNLSIRLKNKYKCYLSVKPPYPKNMLLEPTTVCNYSCIFCANKKTQLKPLFLDKEFGFSILKQAYELGTREVGLYSRGEPTLSPILDDIISKAKQLGYTYIYIDTNGSCSQNVLKKIIDAGLNSIKFSLNAGTSKTYEQIHGVDNFEKVVQNIEYVSNYRKHVNKTYKVYISYVVTKENETEKNILEQNIDNFVDEILYSNVANQGGVMPENKILYTASVHKKKICPVIFNRFNVTADGFLTLCCVDYKNSLIVADLHKTSLAEAWHNAKFVEIRKNHLEDKLERTVCYDCMYGD